ncbi:hypothetical protein BLD50_06770 [Bacillus cereus]|nr:helix-turn-helix domain-containing protein [Bacillus cereus]OLR26510.1 hypothetical protein BLD50_06770 [Bacillus cereus]
MFANKGYTFRSCPNKNKKYSLPKKIGCSRFICNHVLALWKGIYKEAGKGLIYPSWSAKPTQ